jgi:DNA-binding MarR family transcriptional regulator
MRESWEEQFIRGLHRSVCLIDKIADRILSKEKRARISFAQLQVLFALAYKTRLSQQDVAHFLDITEAAVSRHIRLLSESGYVKSISVTGNRRKNELMLTPKGKRELRASVGILSGYFGEIFSEVKTRFHKEALQTLNCALTSLEKADRSTK